MIKIVNIAKWVILFGSLGGVGAAAYLYFTKSAKADISPVHKVKPAENGVSTLGSAGFGGQVNHAMSENEIDKY